MLLLASDGLWDVLTNQEAVNLAQRCLRRARERGASRQAATRVAASVLTRAALDEGSSDNVTVVVIDLSQCVVPPLPCSHIWWVGSCCFRRLSVAQDAFQCHCIWSAVDFLNEAVITLPSSPDHSLSRSI